MGSIYPYTVGIAFQFFKIKKFWTSVAQQCKYPYHYWPGNLKMVKMINFISVFFYPNLKF